MRKNRKILPFLLTLLTCFTLVACSSSQTTETKVSESTNQTQLTSSSSTTASSETETSQSVTVDPEEKAELEALFSELSAVNQDVIGYIYAPGTPLDEPVVQGDDNATYLLKTFEGGEDQFIGTVFLDHRNSKQFDDSLSWLFGHARASYLSDYRAFRTVNLYDDESYFNENRYFVIMTPEKKLYYEVAFFLIVPETTDYYQTSFDSLDDFEAQLKAVKKEALHVNESIEIDKNDHYIVLSTCREEDTAIRANLYLRQLSDAEGQALKEEYGEKLDYQAQR